MTEKYNDDYATCERTHATLRIYHKSIDIEAISDGLEVDPTSSQVRGQAEPGRTFVPRIGGWFLSTKAIVDSRDVRRHIDWILDRLDGKDRVIERLLKTSHRMDIFCFWISKSGHGGPMLSPSSMRRLGALDIPIGFDIYGPYPDEDDDTYGLPVIEE